MNRSPSRLTRIPRARRWGGPRGSAHSKASSLVVAAPAPSAHADPAAVVVRGADPPGRVRDVGQGAVLGDHRLVVDEPAGGQDHPAAGPDGAGSVVGPHQQADDVPVVDHQRLGAGVGDHAGAAGRHGGTEAFHEEAAGGVDPLRLVAARYRGRELVEGIGVLTAAEEQPGVVGRLAVRLVAERRPERHADRDQPVEVVRRALAVGVHAIVVDAGPEGGPQERRHVLRRVLEATGALEGRAASQVDEAAGVGRRPSGPPAPFDGQHVRSCLPRPDDRRRAGDAQTDDDHVDRLVEANLADVKRRDRLHHAPPATGR